MKNQFLTALIAAGLSFPITAYGAEPVIGTSGLNSKPSIGGAYKKPLATPINTLDTWKVKPDAFTDAAPNKSYASFVKTGISYAPAKLKMSYAPKDFSTSKVAVLDNPQASAENVLNDRGTLYGALQFLDVSSRENTQPSAPLGVSPVHTEYSSLSAGLGISFTLK